MRIKLGLLILLSALCINSITAQKNNKKITLTGTVLNDSKAPIVNAIVMIDDQKTNSVTDEKGNYRVKVKANASKIGIFTFGYGTAEEAINGRTRIDFNFGTSKNQPPADQAIAPGEQGVNTGYGMVKKKNVTTDVNKIDGTNKKYASYATIGEMIQREVSGVKVIGSTVVIQNSQDLFGSVPALIVVDGVSMDAIPNIPPTSVKSIEVLKGSAAAIYGTRAYGGVVLIKTKTQNQ
ncbi:MAG: TonB-dependent receptor plug domain-containing protein [Bacteroidales bacterium]